MTAYRNMIGDLPSRAREMLELFYAPAQAKNRECTLLLSVASLVLVTPYERLKKPVHQATNPPHPSADSLSYPEAAEGVARLAEIHFVGSPLWPQSTCGAWTWCRVVNPTQPNDQWQELKSMQPLTDKQECGPILTTLRHAFAHGNIWTTGDPKIDRLYFTGAVRRSPLTWRVFAVSPNDFRLFLLQWCDWLNKQSLS